MIVVRAVRAVSATRYSSKKYSPIRPKTLGVTRYVIKEGNNGAKIRKSQPHAKPNIA